LRRIFKGVEGRSANQARNRYALRIDGLLHSLSPAPLKGATWRAYLLDSGPDRSRILSFAAGTALPNDPNHSIQVLARAILLLRIATGSAERLLRSLPAGRRVDLDPLIDLFGQERCLWGLGGMPGSLNDLAKDPADAGIAIDADLANISSYSELWRRQPWPAAVFSSFERAGLWGMCG